MDAVTHTDDVRLVKPDPSFAGDWPELLVLSDEGPHTGSAGALLLYRLLQDYPPERLRVIERDQRVDCERLHCAYQSLTAPWRRLERSRFNRWHRSLRAFGLVPQVPLRHIDRLLEGFTPSVVLCVMQHAAYYDCAWRLARTRRLPLVVLVHDVNEQFEPVLSFAVQAARRRDAAFYRYAARRLCVSPEMEGLCAALYGAPGQVLYPNRSEDLRPRPFREAMTLKQPGRLTLGFVGNLNYGYGDELLRLLPAFREADVRLIIFSHPPGGSCAALGDATDCCDLRGYAPAEHAWRTMQHECDGVILPYLNPAGRMERLYRHHFPSKLPEYLALGMPVLITGPEYATGVKWGMRNPEATVTYTACHAGGLVQTLERLRVDGAWRLTLAQAGFRAGERDFDPRRIKDQFLNHVRTAAAW